MVKDQLYYSNSFRLNLRINITGQNYSPRGFLEDPRYFQITSVLNKSEQSIFMEGFIKYIAEALRDILKDSIKTQYYKNRWEPLNKSYLEFKQSHGLSSNIWEATGKLYNSISYMKLSDTTYEVGIDPKAHYGTGTPVSVVAQAMEFGNKYMPARPLFRPATRFIQRNIRTLWEVYLINPDEHITQNVINKINKLKREGRWIL